MERRRPGDKPKSKVDTTKYLDKVRKEYDHDNKVVLDPKTIKQLEAKQRAFSDAKAPKQQNVESSTMGDGYEVQRQHVTWMEGSRFALQYRRKKLSDGEARRYFVGFIQVAYVRFYSDGEIQVCGIHADRAHDRSFKTIAAAEKYIMAELQGVEA